MIAIYCCMAALHHNVGMHRCESTDLGNTKANVVFAFVFRNTNTNTITNANANTNTITKHKRQNALRTKVATQNSKSDVKVDQER